MLPSLLWALAATQVPAVEPAVSGCAATITGRDAVLTCPAGGATEPVVAALIDGKAATVLIDPGGDNAVICNPDFVTRAGLFGDGPVHVADVGPVKVMALRTAASVRMFGRSAAATVAWSAARIVANADCVAGPRNLPFDSVRFVLGGTAGGEPITLPFHPAYRGALYGRWAIGRHDLAVRFQPRFARSVVTASLAHAIAPTLGGTATGPVSLEEIAYGVKRPVRGLTLTRPLRIGGLTLRDPLVRVGDYGQAGQISAIDADEVPAGEVTVSARRRPPGSNRFLRIGADDLGRCETLTLDKRQRAFVLAC